MAIAPDWSPSGSSGTLEESKFTAAWNGREPHKVFEDADLVKMATVYRAQLAGLSDKIGSLSRGSLADLLLLRRTGTEPLRPSYTPLPSMFVSWSSEVNLCIETAI
jgi:5-methylthioadenosine/S-adenosylhomocysteine deaminase